MIKGNVFKVHYFLIVALLFSVSACMQQKEPVKTEIKEPEITYPKVNVPDEVVKIVAEADKELKSGNYEASLALYQKAYDIIPEYFRTFQGIAKSYKRLGEKAMKENDSLKAIEMFKKSLEFDPHYKAAKRELSVAYAKQGASVYNEKDYNRAIDFYDLSLSIRPDYKVAIEGKGRCYCRIADVASKEEDYNKSVENYKKAFELRPDYMEALTKLATANIKKGDFNEARKYLNKVKELDKSKVGWADEQLKQIDGK